jgi:hypothetical protein
MNVYLFSVALLLAPSPGDQTPKGSPMRVELDIFSGRPNPTWTLNDEETKEFLARFGSLTAGDPQKPLYDGLGYRGSRVTGLSDYDGLTVWNGIVEARRGEKTYRWRDRKKGLEEFLLKNSKAHIDEGIYKFIKSSIDRE